MYPPGFNLLLAACRLSYGLSVADEAEEIIRGGGIDWDDLSRRTSFHRIEPQLFSLLQRLPQGLVPTTVIERLRDDVQSNLVGQMRYVAEFFRIEEWLRAADITVVPFKGFWLGESAYGNIGARTSSDIDLFIDICDLEKVKSIMTEKGYARHDGVDRLTDAYVRKELAEYNFDRYEDGNCQAHVEFHWRSTMSFYRMDITLDDLRSQMTTGVLQGREITVFSPAANLLLVVMHHGGKECFIQLRQVLDIAHILRSSPDLDTGWLLRQAGRFHVTTLLFMGVRLAHELTGVEVPAPLTAKINDRQNGRPVGSVNGHRTDRLASGRVRLMAKPVDELIDYKERLVSWLFKIQSRDGCAVKANLTYYTLRKIIAPRLAPDKWRHHFFNRKIRRSKVD